MAIERLKSRGWHANVRYQNRGTRQSKGISVRKVDIHFNLHNLFALLNGFSVQVICIKISCQKIQTRIYENELKSGAFVEPNYD